jgi:hypothetical protein
MINNIIRLTFVFLLFAVIANTQTFDSTLGSAKEMSCSDSFDVLTANDVVTLTIANSQTQFFFGYSQLGDSQSPCVARFDNSEQTWCQSSYQTADYASAYGGLYDHVLDSLYIVFSTSGSGEIENIEKYTKGWIQSYGKSGSEEVSVILEVNSNDGNPTGKGTFISAQSLSGATNFAHLTHWEITDVNTIFVIVDAAEFPLDTDLTPLSCAPQSNYYQWNIELDSNLENAIKSTASGCISSNPLQDNSLTHLRNSSPSRTKTPHNESKSSTKDKKSTPSRTRTPIDNKKHSRTSTPRHKNSASSVLCSFVLLVICFAMI